MRTARLHLRPLTLADAPWFHELNADPEVVRWTGDRAFRDLDEARLVLHDHVLVGQYEATGLGRWAVLEGAVPCGWCGLRRTGDEVDLGVRLFRHAWGRGIASEAGAAWLHAAWTRGLTEVVARAHTANHRSLALLDRLGFHSPHQEGAWLRLRRGLDDQAGTAAPLPSSADAAR